VVNVPVTNGLVVHLKFDGDYTDSSGHGNNGTPVGSPAIAAGKIGSAMQYTDADGGASLNYVTMDNPVGTHPADLRMGTNTSFSVSFWYKVPPGNRHGDPALVSNKDWDSGGNTGFVIFNSGSGLQWNYTEVNDGVNANSRKDSGGTSPGLEDGNWHHCLVSFQRGGGAFAYVDGSLVKYLTLRLPILPGVTSTRRQLTMIPRIHEPARQPAPGTSARMGVGYTQLSAVVTMGLASV
jgi:Concanavalin A-like lectin/glucanases superfamily